MMPKTGSTLHNVLQPSGFPLVPKWHFGTRGLRSGRTPAFSPWLTQMPLVTAPARRATVGGNDLWIADWTQP